MNHVVRIVKSYFSLPVWVIVWITLFLVPANFSGYWFLHTETGWWIAVLGCDRHRRQPADRLAEWRNVEGALHAAYPVLDAACGDPRLPASGGADGSRPSSRWRSQSSRSTAFRLIFDYYDFFEWRRGNRAVAGYPEDPVRI